LTTQKGGLIMKSNDTRLVDWAVKSKTALSDVYIIAMIYMQALDNTKRWSDYEKQ